MEHDLYILLAQLNDKMDILLKAFDKILSEANNKERDIKK